MSNTGKNQWGGTDWMESQRKWMEAWLSFTQPAARIKTGSAKNNPLADMMDFWWKSVSGALPEGSSEFVTKMLEQGRFFYVLSEQFTQLLNNVNEYNKATGDWQTALNTQFEEMKRLFQSQQADSTQAMHGMWGAWQQLPLDTLQRTFSSASLMPGDFLADLKPDALESVTDKFLSIPGVGYTRESQEQAQEGIRLWNEYQKNSRDYNVAMTKVSVDALEEMRKRIIKLAEEGEEINSLREIYDLWVDCNEDAYAAYTATEEFSVLYGRLTNSLMAVKHHGRNVVDELLGGLNMPTRRGMNTLQKRQQEMRRDAKEMSRRITDLQDQIRDLQKTVAAGVPKPSGTNGTKPRTAPTIAPVSKPVVKESRKRVEVARKPVRKPGKKDEKIIIKI